MPINSRTISFSQILSTINCFSKQLENLQFNQNQPKSAVSIIIKKSQQSHHQHPIKYEDFVHDQILFLQRKKSPKDRFSAEICFPGGRQQPNETLIDSAIRETFQQTNIQLKKQNLIGCIDRQVNFIITQKLKRQRVNLKGVSQHKIIQKQMVVYAFVFSISEEQVSKKSIKINENEIQSFKWVKASQFLIPSNLSWFDYTDRINSLASVYQFNEAVKQNTQQALKSINRALCACFDIKMNQKLYGITLYILMILLVNFYYKIQELVKSGSGVYSEQKLYLMKQILDNLEQIKIRCSQYFHFEVNHPPNESLYKFQKALFADMYMMRPKL